MTSSMPPQRWMQVKAAFLGALDLAAEERARFLAERCGDDAELRAEVESLLAASGDGEDAFAPPALLAHAAGALASAADLTATLSATLGGRYEIRRELGGGGMSRVFLATERALGREVVIKVLSPELAHRISLERFAREVRVAARLQQANIVPVLTAGDIDGLPYYVMPFVRGESLRARLDARALDAAEVLNVLADVAKALSYAHGEGIVHRDVKPENILISGGTAVVLDFGIAKAISFAHSTTGASARRDTTVTGVGVSLGTPAYMAPEQIAGDRVGAQADVYAFGVVAYECLAGVHPFAEKRTAAEMLAAHLAEMPPALGEIRASVPHTLASLVMRCLAKAPADRPVDGRALLAQLDQAIRAPAASSALQGHPWDADLPSVAVLPLRNLSADPDTLYFSDGITAELLNALTRVRGVRVAAQTSSFAFRDQDTDLRTIAERLGVTTILEGSVRRSGESVRISVQLVNASTGMTLWSERYDRKLTDVFAVQDEIATAIAGALVSNLSRAVGTPAGGTRARAVNPEAFELYLRGRHLVEQRTEGMREALECFDRAIRIDADFSAAYAGIGLTYTTFGIYHALRPHDAFPRARDAALRALEIDPSDALALVVRAHTLLWYEWDFAEAERFAQRALDLAPGLYLAHDCLGWVLAAQGEFEEAVSAMQHARALDPLSAYATYDLAWVLILAGRWDEALRELQPAVARHPLASELHRALGFCLFYTGKQREARAEFERVLQLNAGDRWGRANLVQVLAAMGDVIEARRHVQTLEARAEHEPVPLSGIAVMHHWLGDDDTAIRWLEKAVEARDYWLVMLRFDPSVQRLRGDLRFQALMRRVAPPRGEDAQKR